MGKRTTFKLVDTSLDNTELGEVTFYDDKILFKLNRNISSDQWKKIGIIPYHEKKRASVENSIKYFITSRLPLRLRKAPAKKQFEYIASNGLRVASDSYAFLLA